MTFRPRSGTKPVYRTAAHRQARAAALAAFVPGQPCCLCGKPMHPPTSQLHLDHQPGTLEYRGLAHAACNRSDGARRGARAVNAKRKASRGSWTQPPLPLPAPRAAGRTWERPRR